MTSKPSSTLAAVASGAASAAGEERHALAKLEALKDIRSKTVALEKLRLRLLNDVDTIENEDKCLAEFRREMELLQQEKMAHVEELRQIHADINSMEAVMKQAEEAKRSAHDSARRALEEYSPLKNEVDHMRVEMLGLEKLPDISTDEREKLGSIGIVDKPKPSPFGMTGDPRHPWHHPDAGGAGGSAAEKAAAANAASFFGLGRPPASAPGAGASNPAAGNPFLAAAAAQHSAMGLGPLGHLGSKAASEQLRTSLQAQAAASGPVAPPAFRQVTSIQQPPPMKSCLSCHQQIHRNAPICPLCKAKSRSRNPKKPKKPKEH